MELFILFRLLNTSKGQNASRCGAILAFLDRLCWGEQHGSPEGQLGGRHALEERSYRTGNTTISQRMWNFDKMRVLTCQTRICTMTSHSVITAFSRPVSLIYGTGAIEVTPTSLDTGDRSGETLLAERHHEVRERGGRENRTEPKKLITMPVYLCRETMSVDAIE